MKKLNKFVIVDYIVIPTLVVLLIGGITYVIRTNNKRKQQKEKKEELYLFALNKFINFINDKKQLTFKRFRDNIQTNHDGMTFYETKIDDITYCVIHYSNGNPSNYEYGIFFVSYNISKKFDEYVQIINNADTTDKFTIQKQNDDIILELKISNIILELK